MYKIGIDIGYSTFKYVILDDNNQLIKRSYCFHKGKIETSYSQLIEEIKALHTDEVALGVVGNLVIRLPIYEEYQVNHITALVEGAVMQSPEIQSIIEIGAQDTYFVNHIYKEQKSKLKFYTNSSCASGTGAFLEEQATRLAIPIESLSEYVSKAKSIPRIAGRCSVFSKTDMIHHMQEGTSINDILLGLCYALVRNFKANVVQKHEITKPVLLAGGVMHNEGVITALKDVFNLNDEDIILNEMHDFVTCFGACKVADNEITAQAKGAAVVESGVDTIFEIGGQDSKYIYLNKGLVNNFEMNKICAAGTGAFIEEQIKKLDIELAEFGEYALNGEHPVNLGDRCTVFIEGNIGKAIAEGQKTEDIAAGLAYAIVKNYLNRVVGNRKIGNKILLQGGIAHNQGVVNAFRAILGKEVIVPPFFSVTGALGMAVLTKEHLQETITKEQKKISDDLKEQGEKYYW